MGGGMPFHLEKGALGLRMDYLTRSPKVVDFFLKELNAEANPFDLAADMDIPKVGKISVFNATKAQFCAFLHNLEIVDPTPFDPWERRSAQSYWAEQDKYLLDANKDHTGNRNAFRDYWQKKLGVATIAAALIPETRDVLKTALQLKKAGKKHHVDYWWDCSLDEGARPQVVLAETPGAAHVFFCTDHTPVQPPDTPTRAPLDADPYPLPA